ncbi:RDD family protein [Microbacterium kribbense]|uniref:RDD family protein n=1 Tax=Microbacterium kribbense TaxID=433645 RepID=A0ABP7GQ36_9MICO
MPEAPREQFPGERMGLSESGPLSVARFWRRVGALVIDIASAALIGYAFFHHTDQATGALVADPLAANIIFAIMQILFIPTIGGGPGHRILGMRVVRVGGGWVGVWRPVVRTALLFLIIPALIWDADHRGLHDKAAGTVLIRV